MSRAAKMTAAVAAHLAGGGPRPLAAALGLRTADLDALLRFAERDLARGRAEDAAETLRVAAVLDPRRGEVFAALGRAYRRTGENGRAASAERVAAAIAHLVDPADRHDRHDRRDRHDRHEGADR